MVSYIVGFNVVVFLLLGISRLFSLYISRGRTFQTNMAFGLTNSFIVLSNDFLKVLQLVLVNVVQFTLDFLKVCRSRSLSFRTSRWVTYNGTWFLPLSLVKQCTKSSSFSIRYVGSLHSFVEVLARIQ